MLYRVAFRTDPAYPFHHQKNQLSQLHDRRKTMTLNVTAATARTMKLAIIGFILALASLITTQRVHAQNAAPLVLAKWSYFFVGGKIDPSVEGSPMVGH